MQELYRDNVCKVKVSSSSILHAHLEQVKGYCKDSLCYELHLKFTYLQL